MFAVFQQTLVRELQRLLPNDPFYNELFELYQQVINQLRNTKNKIYSLHEKEVCCISKGKEHKMYEFGNKASFVVRANAFNFIHVKMLLTI